jgi:rubrerythrin
VTLRKLKSAPPPIRSAGELMVIAHAMEEEAGRRYRELAARMRLRREERLASLFDFLASIEDKHAAAVGRRAMDALGRRPAAERVSWDVPENFDEEEGSSHLLTPYRALAVAVRNEERAFAFFSYLAAQAPDDQSRTLAEGLAKDELTHAWLLRRERRKAYRSEGNKRPPVELPSSVEELWELTAATEWTAGCYHRALAGGLAYREDAAAAVHDAAADEVECAVDAAGRIGRELQEQPLGGEPTMAGGLRLLEAAFERYADIAERSKDERVMHEAQRLAARAVRRLTLVRGSLRGPFAEG